MPEFPQPPSVTRVHVAALTGILVTGLLLRAGYLVYARRSPGYVWQDPDGYVEKALQLVGPDGWRWTFESVAHTINGQQHALPPLYSVFLSLFALFPGFPLTAQLGQLALGVAAIALVFALGRLLHSMRTGLVAAAAFAVWVPGIFGVWSTSQETLYLPLILFGFLLFLRAVTRDGSGLSFAAAGAVFGLAALTRSMPLFFMAPAAAMHVALAAHRRRAGAQIVPLLAGFMLVTVPYSVALSRHFGQLAVIDTHGSIHFQVGTGRRAPGLIETVGGLWRELSTAPAAYVDGVLTRARSLLHVNGGRQLQLYVVAGTRFEAAAWKVFVHLANDALLIGGVLLSAFGVVLCRRPRLALFLAAWAALNIGIASVGGFGGARLRVPFEPLLFVLAAVVIAGEWRRPPVIALVLAGSAALTAAVAVVPQVPTTLAAWPDYGVRWPSIFHRKSGQLGSTAAGLNVPAPAGAAVIALRSSGSPATVRVKAGGIHVRTVQLAAGESQPVRALWPARGLAFIELEVVGDPVAIRVGVEGR